ncbi:MAG: phosphoribosylanthranilate isomerase [Planctomycetaceae bacterium]|nr:phosphoribosylanthranilate isomerase [Planctomycetaceae bacterium]
MWTKICGVTRIEDARRIVSLGADAIGLNFYPASKRHVAPSVAKAISDAVRGEVCVVGVFVNEAPEKIIELAMSLSLDAIQFHGDEDAHAIATVARKLPSIAIIRAVRLDSENVDATADHIAQVIRAVSGTTERGSLNTESILPAFSVLIDAHVRGAYGGTGHRVDTETVERLRRTLQDLLVCNRLQLPPMILAGGLTPTTVGQAIRSVRPWGIDTASGVESAPGIKDDELVRRFIREVVGTVPAENESGRP